jgi:hypothetical protein
MKTCYQPLLLALGKRPEYTLVRYATSVAIVVTIGTGAIAAGTRPVPDMVANLHQVGLEVFETYLLLFWSGSLQVIT